MRYRADLIVEDSVIVEIKSVEAVAPAGFFELVAPAGPGLTECVIELEGPRGKLRIQRKGTTAPDLAGLNRALWESA